MFIIVYSGVFWLAPSCDKVSSCCRAPTAVAVNPASGGSRVLFSFENSEFFSFGRFGFILGMGVASIADRRDMMCTSTTTEGAP